MNERRLRGILGLFGAVAIAAACAFVDWRLGLCAVGVFALIESRSTK